MKHGDTAGQKKRFWREHVERWTRGGLTQRDYCQQHGLAMSTFQLWRRRLATAAPEPCFDIVPVVQAPRAALHLQSQPLALVLEGGRYRVEIGEGARVETLRTVLDALEGRS